MPRAGGVGSPAGFGWCRRRRRAAGSAATGAGRPGRGRASAGSRRRGAGKQAGRAPPGAAGVVVDGDRVAEGDVDGIAPAEGHDQVYPLLHLRAAGCPNAALPVGETRLRAGGWVGSNSWVGRPRRWQFDRRTGPEWVCALLGYVTSTSTPGDREARDDTHPALISGRARDGEDALRRRTSWRHARGPETTVPRRLVAG
jgi:hypothetical protein